MRIIAAIIVLLVLLVIVLATIRPILASPTMLEMGAAYLVDFVTEGCGPGWHWSNRRGLNWGRCIRDRRLIRNRPT